MDLKSTMIEICSMGGPSGFEDEVSKRCKELLTPYVDEVSIDIMGNVIGVKRCGKENAKKLLLDAHIDEIGFIITGHEEGFLKFSTIGGVDPRMLPACGIKILTDEPIYGVVATMPPHILKPGEADEPTPIDDMYIDIGMTQEEAEKAVPVGTPAVYDCGAVAFGEDYVCGKTLDDRACFAILLKAAELLKDEKLDVDLYIMGSTQEEVGLRGAKAGTFGIAPDISICVDVCHAATPDCKKVGMHDLGSGVDISRGPNMNRAFTDFIIETAKKNNIKYVINAEPGGSSGTNTTAIQITREGVATALFGLPLKYMHTPVEVISIEDASAIANLIAETTKALKEGTLYA